MELLQTSFWNINERLREEIQNSVPQTSSLLKYLKNILNHLVWFLGLVKSYLTLRVSTG